MYLLDPACQLFSQHDILNDLDGALRDAILREVPLREHWGKRDS
jgi:hypothetical protein